MTRPTYMITTAIPYANGAPHIGHAYERVATDAFARWKRLDGFDVLFVTGMDEHGQKMQRTAEREGLTPQQLADRTAAQFQHMGELLNARADDVVRTTQPRHKEAVLDIWRRMEANGDVYLSKYAGWYSVRDEAYFDESELSERDGKKFAPTGAPVEWVEEESWFFKLSAYGEKLLAHYEANPGFVTPEHYKNEVVAFVKRGLEDLSISRTTFDWGIPIPPSPQTSAHHVCYVWVDALTNYITATGWLSGQGERQKFWPADAHVIGKDITRFHAIFWPAFLMSAGAPLPKRIVVHGFLFSRGEKMSKSVGNVVDPIELASRYGVDQLRYFFLREISFGQDGNYSHEAIVNRINADLANDLGNLAQRSLSMINKNCGAAVPKKGTLLEADKSHSRRDGGGAGEGARRDGRLSAGPRARRDFPRRRGGEPLFCGRGAMGEKEDGPGPDGDRPLRHRRDDPPTRASLAGLHPHGCRCAPGSARRLARGARSRQRGGKRCAEGGRASAPAVAGIPAIH